MYGRRTAFLGITILMGSSIACSGGAGTEGTSILADYSLLAGGIVYATSAIEGANGYDLFWSPVPSFPTLDAQPAVRLTDAGGDEWQPSASPGGHGIAYNRKGDGIFLIDIDGRVNRISRTDGTAFVDSSPAVSWDGSRVAWVREDTSRPIAGSGFFETEIWLANFDGSDARALAPTPGTIQDAPKFQPGRDASQLVWSEFSALNLSANGPQNFGVRVFDWRANTDLYLCQDPGPIIDGAQYRCFGQHTAWPIDNAIILTQSFLELYLDGRPSTSVYFPLVNSVSSQNIGAPVLEGPQGFFFAFPMSASYQGVARMVFDGVVTSIEGNLPNLGFFIAEVDGQSVWPLNIQGRNFDYDPINTAGFLFSVATPQFIPATEAL